MRGFPAPNAEPGDVEREINAKLYVISRKPSPEAMSRRHKFVYQKKLDFPGPMGVGGFGFVWGCRIIFLVCFFIGL